MKSHDLKQQSKHDLYLKTNNLYGHAMSKFLATSGFKWLDLKEFDLNKYNSDNSKGCVLKVDFEYPKELRELYNHYKTKIKREILSEYQLKAANLYNITIGNVKKLLPNLFDKEKHVFRYENLKLYLRQGSKLKNIYRVLEFNQSQWLKQHIEFNTQKRIEPEKKKTKLEKSCTI